MPDPTDLDALRIDRGEGRRRSERRRSRWPARVAWIGALALCLWVFQRQLLDLFDRFRLPEVELARAVRREAGAAAALSGTAANGYVVARTRAALSSDVPGRLVEIRVVEGTRVSRGDVVARLYSDELEAALARAEADLALAEAALDRSLAEQRALARASQRLDHEVASSAALVSEAEAQLAYARADHGRAAALVALGDLSPSRLDEATRELAGADARRAFAGARLEADRAGAAEGEERLKAAAAAVAEAEARVAAMRAARVEARAALEKTFIRAPFDGIVVQKEAEVGEVVSPNSQGGSLARGSVATMVDLASLEVQADVPETSLSAVRVGAATMIYLDAWPGEPYRGRVDRIWPVADRQKATIEVRVAFERLDERLRPDMGVRVVFLEDAPAPDEGQLTASAVVLVPAAALVRDGGLDGVFLLERDRARFRPLILGGERAGRVVAEEGLSGGENLILSPPASLRSGDRVRAKELP